MYASEMENASEIFQKGKKKKKQKSNLYEEALCLIKCAVTGFV